MTEATTTLTRADRQWRSTASLFTHGCSSFLAAIRLITAVLVVWLNPVANQEFLKYVGIFYIHPKFTSL
jgi:hypothetical protein